MAAHDDVLRDGPARLLGYANEVGEAFRPVAPRLVLPSYGVAAAYVLLDTAHKASLAETPRARQRAAIDTLAWQTLASVVLPGFTINRVVFAARFAAERAGPRAPAALARWGPVGLGLATIPLIVKPIDEAVHVFMGATVRKWEP